PANLDLSLVDTVYKVTDDDAYLGCRTLVRAEGILAGVSTGGALMVALAEAMRRPPHQRVAFLASDRGERYLATAFNDDWIRTHGLRADRSVDELRRRAHSLTPVSTDPVGECANHLPGLARKLGSPTVAPDQVVGR